MNAESEYRELLEQLKACSNTSGCYFRASVQGVERRASLSVGKDRYFLSWKGDTCDVFRISGAHFEAFTIIGEDAYPIISNSKERGKIVSDAPDNRSYEGFKLNVLENITMIPKPERVMAGESRVVVKKLTVKKTRTTSFFFWFWMMVSIFCLIWIAFTYRSYVEEKQK